MARSTGACLWLAVLLVLPFALAPAQQPAETEPAAETTETTDEAAALEADAAQFISPQIILGTQQQPVFPPAAWDARYTGAVLLEMTVLKDGTIGEVEVVRSTHPKVGFEAAAVAAVKQWRFEPGMENGEPIEVKTRIKINFSRVGVGVRAQPQVSAGSFTVESRLDSDVGTPSRGFSSGTGGGDPK
jgi:TonB family protein